MLKLRGLRKQYLQLLSFSNHNKLLAPKFLSIAGELCFDKVLYNKVLGITK